jgi:hypothetical protein
MTQPESQPAAIDCIFDNILAFMLPFFLSAAGGDANLGRATIQQLAEAYNATTATELELVGRILGFSTVAMDNLRLSMNPGMSDTKILRYRSNAVALSRAGEQCRKILEAVQASRKPAETPIAIPRPAIAAAPPEVKAHPLQATPNHNPNPPRARPIPTGIEAMKREARTMLAAFSNTGGASAAFPQTQDPAALIGAAVRDAIASSKRNAAA